MSTAVVARCEATTRAGQACRLPAGHGTSHPGSGRCRRHGGATPNGAKAAAKEALAAEARSFGLETDEDPLTSLLRTVRLSAGMRDELRRRAEALGPDAPVDSPEVVAYGAELKHHAQIVKLALDAGIAEREIRLVERMADMISAAFEDALGPAGLSEAERQAVAERFSGGLARLEQGDVIEGQES